MGTAPQLTPRRPCTHINDLPQEILCMILKPFTKDHTEHKDRKFGPTVFALWRVCTRWSRIVFTEFLNRSLEESSDCCLVYMRIMKQLEQRYLKMIGLMRRHFHPLVWVLCGPRWERMGTTWGQQKILRLVIWKIIDEDVARHQKEVANLWLC